MKLKKLVILGFTIISCTINTFTIQTALAETVKENELDIVMAGDVLLHTRLNKWSEDGKGGYDYKPIFKKIKEN